MWCQQDADKPVTAAPTATAPAAGTSSAEEACCHIQSLPNSHGVLQQARLRRLQLQEQERKLREALEAKKAAIQSSATSAIATLANLAASKPVASAIPKLATNNGQSVKVTPPKTGFGAQPVSRLMTPDKEDEEQSYQISDYCPSDEDEDEVCRRVHGTVPLRQCVQDNKPEKPVPQWAKGQTLKNALYNQFTSDVNPEHIFPHAVSPPDLHRIFHKAPAKNKIK